MTHEPATRGFRWSATDREEADMAGTDVKPGNTDTETGGVACPACPHAQDTHDAISRRYCTATVAGGLNRRCVCVGGGDPVKDRS